MKIHSLSSCLTEVLLGALFLCISSIALAAERGACYFSARGNYYKFEWRVLSTGGTPKLDVFLYKALYRDENLDRPAQEQRITLDPIKETTTKYGTLVNKNANLQTNGLSWAQSINYDFTKKDQGWFFMPNNKRWQLVIANLVSNDMMDCKVTYFPDTITAIPSGPAPYTGPACTVGMNSDDYAQYKSIYDNGVKDIAAGCSTM